MHFAGLLLFALCGSDSTVHFYLSIVLVLELFGTCEFCNDLVLLEAVL
uniref:Uncharacterized protein n=1 Tax=Arundo donax TaxID=35708 RepID=A0A0A8ZSJ1_ARUDO